MNFLRQDFRKLSDRQTDRRTDRHNRKYNHAASWVVNKRPDIGPHSHLSSRAPIIVLGDRWFAAESPLLRPITNSLQYLSHPSADHSVASLRLASSGATTGVSPIFPQKNWQPFSHRPLQSDDLAVVSSPLPPSDVVYPVLFLNWATKINLSRVSPHGWCHAGRSAPPSSDATVTTPGQPTPSAEGFLCGRPVSRHVQTCQLPYVRWKNTRVTQPSSEGTLVALRPHVVTFRF